MAPPARTTILGKSETITSLHRIVDSAQKTLWLISPYTRLGKLRDLTRRLTRALNRNVRVSLIVRSVDSSTSRWERADLEELNALRKAGLKVFEVRDLHAKVYFSESHALVTSLNLVESSFNNSIEVGVEIPKAADEYRELVERLRVEVKEAMTEVKDFAVFAAATPTSFAAAPSSARANVTGSPARRLKWQRRDGDDDTEVSEEDDADDACFRCGRPGHWASDCYARTTLDGDPLDDDDEDDDDDDDW